MTTDAAANPDRRSELLGIKLSALVRDRVGDDAAPAAVPFPPGAGVRVGDTVWALLDDGAGPRLGAALAVAVRRGATALAVIAADRDSAGIVARRATAFTIAVDVFVADGRTLVPVEPAPVRSPDGVPAHHRDLHQLVIDGGAEPIEEWGALAGEVRGLEVCRVVDDPATGVTRLEVGTGAHDREAFTMMHGDVPTVDSLRRVVTEVDSVRSPGGGQHPLSRLAPERLLRWRAITDPSLAQSVIGATQLEVAEPPEPRPNLRDPYPAVAVGRSVDGRPLVAVFSSGVDLELVPFAADARLAVASRRGLEPAGIDLVIATPARDQVQVTADLADLLTVPARLAIM